MVLLRGCGFDCGKHKTVLLAGLKEKNQMNELISVIVPVYNVEKYLARCVESIRKQTYSNLEIILVDDGSPDACPQMCDQFASDDSRIKVIHKPNGGLSDARNAGIEAASGAYIGFVDSDDYIHPQMYMELWKGLKAEEGADIAVCGVKKVFDDGGDIPDHPDNRVRVYSGREAVENIFNASLYLQSVVAWNKLYKRELFDEVRYPAGKLHEDEFTTYELFYKSDKVVYNTGIYYYYYQRADSIMGERKTTFSSDGLEAYEQMADFFEKKGETHILQLIRYRYLCLLKKYVEELRKTDHPGQADTLWKKYKEEYRRSIWSIRKPKRRFRLRVYRWFRINF